MFVGDIEKLAEENSNFRKAIFTDPRAQLVVMSIPSASDIGEEIHPKNIDNEDLKLYTVYAPPHHPDGTIHATKEAAMTAEK